METSRPQPAMLEGLSRFLIEHERCGAGFDVAHPAGVGSGRVSITCRGCGARHEYLTSTIEIEREVQFQVQSAPETAVGSPATPPKIAAAPPPEAPAEAAPVARQPAFKPKPKADPASPKAGASSPSTKASSPPAGASSSPPGTPPSPAKAPAGDGPARRSSAPPPASGDESGRGITGARAGTVALLAVAVIAVVVALLRLSGGSNDDNAQIGAAPSGGNQTPTTTPQQPAQPQQPQQPEQPGAPSDLRKVTTPTYTLDVPADWAADSSGPALRVTPSDSDAVVLRVYSDERPDLSLADMGRLSGQLLQSDHPGSSLSSVHATKVGGIDAATVGVDFNGGSETAFAIARDSQRYLLLVAVSKDASAAERRQMATVVSSFKPA
jgi:hypothetical protein